MAQHRNTAMELLSICVQMGWYGGRTMPVLLEGVPGCGKTQAVTLVGDKLAQHLAENDISDTFYVSHNVLPQTMPETIEGIPSPNMEAMALERLPLIGIRRLMEAQYGIWFGDEVTSAPAQTGAATMTLIQDGVAGDVKLPHTVGRVMACNPADCAASGRDLTPPEINRVVKINWELPFTDFLDYIRGGEGIAAHIRILPPDWEEKHKAHAATLVASFLESQPHLANTMKSGKTTTTQASEPWASERQWENVIRVLAACLSIGDEPASDIVYTALKGMIGEGNADLFIGYLREMDLPNPEDLIAAAIKWMKSEAGQEKDAEFNFDKHVPSSVSSRPDKLRLCLESVAVAAQQKDNENRLERWYAAWKILGPILRTKPDNAEKAAWILCKSAPATAAADLPAESQYVWTMRSKTGLAQTSRVK